MQNKTLFFLTNSFPYSKDETFLENEIVFLAKEFSQIVIFTRNCDNGIIRKIPANVIVYHIQSIQINHFSVFMTLLKEKQILIEFIKNVFTNPLKNKILWKSLKNAIEIVFFINKIIKEYEAEKSLFYSYWLDDTAIALALLKNNEVKISRAHGWDVYFERHLYNYLPLRNFITKKLNAIFTVSENGKKYLCEKIKNNKNIQLSRLGTLNATQIIFEKTNNNPVLLSVSHINALKRLDLIGNSFNYLKNNEIQWFHFGEGELIDKMKINYPFAVFRGYVDNFVVIQEFAKIADRAVLINVSSSEGLPVSMMEAMSFGIPCIGTNVGGVSEIIEDGVNGYLMQKNPTVKEVASYIQKYIDLSDEQKITMRKNARKTWEEKFNAEKNYPLFINQMMKSQMEVYGITKS